MIQVGQQFLLTIKRIGINGEGVGYFKKQVVFVPGALPGEEVVVEATKVEKNYAEARVKKIRKKSPHRIQPRCPVYEQCGGCQLQHLDYEAQLEAKRDIVIQAFERHFHQPLEESKIRKTIGMDNPWHYRNKSQFQVGKEKEKVIAGLYSLNSHRLVDISHCFIQHEKTIRATNTIKMILQDLRIPIYNERKRTGIVRTIVVRVGFQTGDLQVVLVTATKEIPRKELFISEMKRRLPEVKSIVQNINGQKTSLIFGEETFLLEGEEYIQEVLGDLSFELSARAFFQLNPVQTVKLYDEVKKAAALTGNEKIVDAYCGVGSIGLWLAKEAKEVRGMDIIPEAIEDAKKNAAKHGFTNTMYVVGKAEKWLPAWVKEGWKPDVIIVDPPRTGCDRKLLETILKVKPKKIIYVSCNPSTLAKDVDVLAKHYDVHSIQPVDMFPHTAHVESVTQLMLKVK
ncbi:23S rRNA m(5)U-1939 methyltransferase [Thermolongibacillus altinsuensis]|jgi:23S rRNA (uracil-5-)-methyltransferase RumA|uniref:23S rRNA m(5)U-1939 methyltransferase n=1 Tax=Thermolongibacillus altinsuensis TaxID=575256 RepID=A0A4R1QB66_9BACL|nr:23S rRNA (uracil(1939)-C(5))-methyltransferase RlmD [Thermolongibacillus altinsuensis]TCL46782.1 23S rRNA m(5)U-1939 methyltransferase [Thermolongibacillus altinsuensis]GMB09284.1 tRNA (uracil-5-)-methyltransferase [Thermolongibacillus altinsuensis]